jgi:limonene 1,2-monooxygenase
MLGVGPGALPSDARTLGIEPAVQRERMDEALGVILRLLRDKAPFSHKSDWFELNEAQLQIKPLQDDMPVVAASSISPAGMKAAGKYGVGVISIASYTSEGLAALPTQWSFGETYAAENGNTMDRSKWRILMQIHLAESKEQAIREVADGVLRWHNEYNVHILGRPNAAPADDGEKLARTMDESGGTCFGTPDDLVEKLNRLQEVSGGFGTVLGFAHDWATPEQCNRSWELIARHVVPRVNGLLEPVQRSADFVSSHKGELMEKAGQAVLGAIRAHNAAHPRPDGVDGNETAAVGGPLPVPVQKH